MSQLLHYFYKVTIKNLLVPYTPYVRKYITSHYCSEQK